MPRYTLHQPTSQDPGSCGAYRHTPTSHKRSPLRTQKTHYLSHFFSLSSPPQRCGLECGAQNLLDDFFWLCTSKICLNHPRTYGIDSNRLFSILYRSCFCEACNGVLGRDILENVGY